MWWWERGGVEGGVEGGEERKAEWRAWLLTWLNEAFIVVLVGVILPSRYMLDVEYLNSCALPRQTTKQANSVRTPAELKREHDSHIEARNFKIKSAVSHSIVKQEIFTRVNLAFS